ncbi:MAG: hypothetical protein WBC06_19235 [Chitinophagaceae bacterium]
MEHLLIKIKKNVIVEYIKNQKERHIIETFFDEYKRILIEHDISLTKNICCNCLTSSGVKKIFTIPFPLFKRGYSGLPDGRQVKAFQALQIILIK